MDKGMDMPRTDRRARWLIIAIAVLALVQTIRVFAFQLAQDVMAGTAPLEWLYPAYLDIVVGATAPFVAFGIWRRTGLAVWTAAIIWFTVSIIDHLDALTVILNSSGPLPASFPASDASSATMFLAGSVVIEALAALALARKSLRTHFLASHGSVA